MELPVTFTQKLRKDGSVVIPAYILKDNNLEAGDRFELQIKQFWKGD